MSANKTFYQVADEFGDWFGQPKIERIEIVHRPTGFSEGFLKQIEADRKLLGLPPLGEEE